MMAGFAILSMNMNVAIGMQEPLSSYGYLQGLTGVRYDAVDKTLFIDSKIGDFTSFLSTETGFGTVTLKAESLR